MSVTPITKAAGWRRSIEQPDDIGPVEEFLGRFATHLAAAGRADKTIERYLRAASQLGAWLEGGDVASVGRTDMESYIVWRRSATSASTAATDYVSLQQFFKFVKLDLGATGSGFTSPMDGMTAPRCEPPRIAIVPEEFLAALIREAEQLRPYTGGQDRSFEDIRDAALMRVFVDTGARLSEVTYLTLNQVVNSPRLTVIGKSKGRGPVMREVELGDKARRALARYLRNRQAHPMADTAVLWLGKKGPLTPNGVRQMIKRRSEALGMHVHPHMFRHTKADAFLSGDGSEGDLMRIMGWRSDTMAKRYGAARADERALEAQRRIGFQGDRI